MQDSPFQSINQVETRLAEKSYICDRPLATSIFLSLKLSKPLFLEGEAGVGKTEVAKVLSSTLDRGLIRLQCYEGLDLNSAVYEWNYSRQLLHIRLLEATAEENREKLSRDIFGPEFLLRRPLLQAIDYHGNPPVLLIDELDRADEEFEAFLLEILSDFQVTIPEIGTIRAPQPPIVVITSNRTREIHDALKRRCLYCWIDYPSFEKELQIIVARVPEAPSFLSRQVVGFIQRLRQEELYKKPGVAESLDWISALIAMNRERLDEEVVTDTLGVLLKYQDDIEHVRGSVTRRILHDVERDIPIQSSRG